MRSIQIPDEHYRIYLVTVFSGIIILLLEFFSLAEVPLLIILVLLITSIFYGLKVWIQVLGAVEITVARGAN